MAWLMPLQISLPLGLTLGLTLGLALDLALDLTMAMPHGMVPKPLTLATRYGAQA